MRKSFLVPVCLVVVCLLAVPAGAVVQKKQVTELDPLQKTDPALANGRVVAPYQEVADLLPNKIEWQGFAPALGDVRQLYFDVATGEPSLVKGAPLPFIPGRGNALALADLTDRLGRPVTEVDAAVVGAVADRFLDDHAGLLRVPRHELVPRSTTRATDALWVVTYEHAPGGIPVAGSRLTLVVGHGNLILWGSEDVFPLDPGVIGQGSLTSGQALGVVEDYVGWDGKRDELIGGPKLVLLPAKGGSGLLSAASAGKRHRLVWEMVFRRDGVLGQWLAQVDAVNGEVLQFGDVNRYGWIRGGIYPTTWTETEVSRPLGLVNLNPGGFSSIEGLFTAAGTVTGSLDGERAEIQDQCGAAGFPSVDSDVNGNVNFGTGPPNPAGDADCTNNGVGNNAGAHNTHAARSAYYHITRMKRKGSDWLPTNIWLAGSHEVRVNIDNVCNAYWSPGGGYNGFFREGFYGALHCFNTGEIGAIFLHEVGHGLDQNDAQGTADGGTGETYADVAAMLEFHDSCMGPGFWSQQCTGYGFPCTDCSGVRDQDYAKHVDGAANPVTTPFTPANFTSSCPGGFFGTGPCGAEVHCEAYPAGGAIWDLATRKLTTGFDAATAWFITERSWMLGMQTSTAMFNCNSTTFASDGCAATSWFQAMLAADDDDGNLANGTPHAAYLFEAFDDHAIACGSSGDPENQNASACPSLAAPSLAATADVADIDLSWNAVANAQGYAVLKNHGDCDLGYLQATTVGSGTTSWSDTDVIDHQPYAYRVVALGASGEPEDNSCFSDLSNCAVASITACPAAVASAPGLANPTDNEVTVTWDDSGTCSSFRVYRKQGGCAAAGSFDLIASGLGGSPYSDLTVSGGITYGYQISAVDPSGSFETGTSPCSEITPTGVCNLAPTYDASGLTATNSEVPTCAIDLDWNTGSTTCPAQSVVYNVYRSTTSGFSPGDGNRIASGVAGTTYQDPTVDFGETYFYIVRAEALTGIGPGPNGGVEETNTFEASASPSGPFNDLVDDDLESGTAGWTVDAAQGADTWTLVTTASHSPTHAWFVPDTATVQDHRLVQSGPVALSSANGELHFWHQVNTESTFDGGVLEYSTDGGSTWFDILAGDGGSVPANANRFVQEGYNSTISGSFSSPIANRDAWTGNSGGFVEVIVDLGDFAGESVTFRWRFASDVSVSSTGWWVDDVLITEGSACFDLIFADGFESGDTSAWSVSVP